MSVLYFILIFLSILAMIATIVICAIRVIMEKKPRLWLYSIAGALFLFGAAASISAFGNQSANKEVSQERIDELRAAAIQKREEKQATIQLEEEKKLQEEERQKQELAKKEKEEKERIATKVAEEKAAKEKAEAEKLAKEQAEKASIKVIKTEDQKKTEKKAESLDELYEGIFSIILGSEGRIKNIKPALSDNWSATIVEVDNEWYLLSAEEKKYVAETLGPIIESLVIESGAASSSYVTFVDQNNNEVATQKVFGGYNIKN